MVDDAILNEQLLEVMQPYITLSKAVIVEPYRHPLVVPGGGTYHNWVWNARDSILECQIRDGHYHFLYRNRRSDLNWAAIYSLEDMICGSIKQKDTFINLITTLGI